MHLVNTPVGMTIRGCSCAASELTVVLQVCEYQAQLSSVKEAQAAAKAAAGENQDLEQEVQEAFEEMNTQRAIYDKYAPSQMNLMTERTTLSSFPPRLFPI